MCRDCEKTVPAAESMIEVNLGGCNGYICQRCWEDRLIEEGEAILDELVEEGMNP